jgi:predicted adenine nucleotide alpha hydrolase (AANH) superfamily ATPase
MRLEQVAQYARAHQFDSFTTTLSISPHKRAAVINRIGEELAQTYGVAFYAADFKKEDGFKISCRMSQELGLYRQNYCGCIFSRREQDA